MYIFANKNKREFYVLKNFRGTKTLKFNEPIKAEQVKANCITLLSLLLNYCCVQNEV